MKSLQLEGQEIRIQFRFLQLKRFRATFTLFWGQTCKNRRKSKSPQSGGTGREVDDVNVSENEHVSILSLNIAQCGKMLIFWTFRNLEF